MGRTHVEALRRLGFVDVVAVLRKQADKPFVTPFDGRYYVDTTDGGFQPRATTGSRPVTA